MEEVAMPGLVVDRPNWELGTGHAGHCTYPEIGQLTWIETPGRRILIPMRRSAGRIDARRWWPY